jgi:6-pyruvoyltetrahydropterin/6-carboxytetrahydropterin synthase
VSRQAIIEISKDELCFSAGHLMTYPASGRESLHGHDYRLQVTFNTTIIENGMAFDCREFKSVLKTICDRLDYHIILPGLSDKVTLREDDTHLHVLLEDETFSLLKRDTVVLPICNVTLEEMSYWFLQQIGAAVQQLKDSPVLGLIVRVFNGRGESAASVWGVN